MELIDLHKQYHRLKKEIDESPALVVAELLKKEGAKIDYYDSWIKKYRYKGEFFEMK